MEYIYVGKIVNTHGIKGEVRIVTDFKYKERALAVGKKIYIGKDKIPEKIIGYRHHKIFEMIMMEGYNDIDQVLKYKGDYVFVNKDDIILGKNEYLDEDIIGLSVFVDNKCLGTVKKIENHNGNMILAVFNDNKNYLIPYNFDIIRDVDLKKREMHVKDIIGLFD